MASGNFNLADGNFFLADRQFDLAGGKLNLIDRNGYFHEANFNKADHKLIGRLCKAILEERNFIFLKINLNWRIGILKGGSFSGASRCNSSVHWRIG